ncbi:hypothetical protein QFC20_004685 [Naganishia adeliensis]|uniref:Uncharacterized protein n=1 Tax=Naganishia adeliensis TaxID=92952 RepID=A0ACC2VZ55_9TREE|nr:hypothetical protein QFC20_004685 [Naganishia adeliensis]
MTQGATETGEKYKPSEHDGLKEDGTPDKRVSSEHGFGGDRERASEAAKAGGSAEKYKPSEHDGLKEDGTTRQANLFRARLRC